MSESNGEKHIIQEPPFSIQIELTEGCNLACSFCGIQGIRKNSADGPKEIRGKSSPPFKFLTIKKALVLANRIVESGWNPRIEFAMHGEPLLNKKHNTIFSIFRNALPKASLQLTTNGVVLLSKPGPAERIENIMKSGINVIKLDSYVGVNAYEKIYDAIKDRIKSYDIKFFPTDKSSAPHTRRKPGKHEVVFVEDISESSDKTLEISNHASCSFPPDYSHINKRCAKPFREMSIRWDGKVAICCNDWRGYYKCGNAIVQPLEKLWNNKYFNAARIRLYHRMRDFGPCHGCDAISFRVGFLPDKKGKETMPEPSKRNIKIIEKALSGNPYTKAIKKEWEK
jgi:hypothetical protein